MPYVAIQLKNFRIMADFLNNSGFTPQRAIYYDGGQYVNYNNYKGNKYINPKFNYTRQNEEHVHCLTSEMIVALLRKLCR